MRACAGRATAARPDATSIASRSTPATINDATTGLGYPRNSRFGRGPQGIVSPGFAGRGLPPGPGWSLTGGTDHVGQSKGEDPCRNSWTRRRSSQTSTLTWLDQGFDQAEQFAEQKTGGHFDSQIQAGEQQAEGFLGVTDQDNQGQDNQDQDNQGQDNQGQDNQGQGATSKTRPNQ